MKGLYLLETLDKSLGLKNLINYLEYIVILLLSHTTVPMQTIFHLTTSFSIDFSPTAVPLISISDAKNSLSSIKIRQGKDPSVSLVLNLIFILLKFSSLFSSRNSLKFWA